ncbi:MAG: ABC transporter substrate-binding protein [Actinomycetota bacterium]
MKERGEVVTTKRTAKLLALVAVLAVLATACGGEGEGGESETPSVEVTQGGTYRTSAEDFGFTGAFDPTGEYLGSAWGLYTSLLLRNLVTYKHVGGVEGDDIVPDIAESWETSADGLTWTFHLKSGVEWGPPLNRDVTSADVEYAFERINAKSLAAQYGYYYTGVIEGMTGQEKAIKPVSGIETPDDSTIIFHLVAPTGDLLYRLAMPATAPMPKEVAGCFKRAGEYGRYVMSSGPYMIKGQDELDVSSCDTLEPISGFDPTKYIVFVRNPNYDPATDESREANVDGVVITINTNTEDIYNKVLAGELDGTGYPAGEPPAPILRQYLTDPELEDKLKIDSGDRTWYIFMNLLVPPFDDIHVRKAVNFVIDKAALQKAWGGPSHGEIATSIEPPTVLATTAEYDPYATPNHEGDVQAAMDEMKQSKYDADGDGVCDADVCDGVLMINRNYPPFSDMSPVIQDNLAQIGINIKVRELDSSTAYTTDQTVENLIPIAANAGWGKDYADPSTFAVLFLESGISCTGQVNYSEVGMTQAQAEECNVIDAWNAATSNGQNPLPNVDEKFTECNAALGDARTTCWTEFDQYLMEEVVPWAPYLWATVLSTLSDSVTKYEFDQFAGTISYSRIAVDNGLDPNTVPVG